MVSLEKLDAQKFPICQFWALSFWTLAKTLWWSSDEKPKTYLSMCGFTLKEGGDPATVGAGKAGVDVDTAIGYGL